ncbi:hypothetical protein LL240_16965 [Oceanimonas baumannii]|uniref:hypothetical protein n=1 Tax=Oceanimonas baumannii TaxID=129578 RepID=UPI001D195DBD|nr:hypothetical protein [Oceanimonas baumannii]MCC4266129.1 hypothetical protein [Oceanimonas baumannii]
MSHVAVMGTLFAAVFLALLHVLVNIFHWERVIPRKYWLSFADGISISYVFLQLLPEIVEGVGHLPESFGPVAPFLEHNPFFPLLIGLVVFSGLVRLMDRPAAAPEKGVADGSRVWSHIASYAFYKGLVGYIIASMTGLVGILVFVIPMTMHFLVVDYRLLEIHKGIYQRSGRWILSAAILIGWAIGVTTTISPAVVALLLAFVAGGIVLIVLEEEFSRDHPSSFGAFLMAVVLYSVLHLFL